MKEINVSEATGPALDWLVAKCEGLNPIFTRHYVTPSHTEDPKKVCIPASAWVQPFEPCINWAQGGPIITREKISIRQWVDVPVVNAYMPVDNAGWSSDASMPLIAAMRCYVASKLGDIVEVPEELLNVD